MKHADSRKGFTLVEVLVGVVVISLISVASFTTVSILTRSTEASRNRIIASNFMQKSMEEVRRVAQSNFDDLETCAFPSGAATTGDPCGFEVTVNDFPEFTRTLNVQDEYLNSEELKRVTVTTNWNEMGVARSLTSVMLLSRPPDPLPGNIWGKVHEAGDDTDLIGGAQVRVTKVDGTDNQNALSTGSLDADGHNYDFEESVSGQFILDAGSWALRVTKTGYEDYDHPVPVVVPPGGPPATVDIPMVPLPEPAEVTYRLVDKDTGGGISYWHSYGGPYVYLREGSGSGGRYDSRRSDDTYHTFTVPFEEGDPATKCLTLFTWQAYKAMRVYPTPAGGSPSCTYQYNKDGWSSAYVRDSAGTLMCSNDHWDRWNSGGIDRICVGYGDHETIDVPLERTPTVTVTGKIEGFAPGTTPRLYVLWPRSLWNTYMRNSHIYYYVNTDADGNFSVELPAVQGFYRNSSAYWDYMRIRPRGVCEYGACCEQTGTTWRWGSYTYVGPLFPGGSTINVGTLSLPSLGDYDCGNVNGNIVDAKTGGSVNNARVRVRYDNAWTNATGYYEHVCGGGVGYRIEENGGRQRVRVYHGSYYDLDTYGNSYYSSKAGVDILADQTVTWNGKLWPIGTGTVNVTVVDKSTMLPIEDAHVRLDLFYTGSDPTATTNSGGVATFNNVRETWPPAAMDPTDTYYNHTDRDHSVSVYAIDDGNFELPVSANIETLDAGGTVNITLEVIPKGAM
jgi:prepilin-type N-terminal cleavage/methylation domain-containing protein